MTAGRRPVGAGGPSLIGVGAVLILISIILQSAKVSYDGVSASASEVNSICHSMLGQIGQAFSGSLGSSAPQQVCGHAAAIEDWKAVALWFGIAFIAAGAGTIWRRVSQTPGQPYRQPALMARDQIPAASFVSAERADARVVLPQADATISQAQRSQQPPPTLPTDR